MTKTDALARQAGALLVQKHQVQGAERKLGEIQGVMDALDRDLRDNDVILDSLCAQAAVLQIEEGIVFETDSAEVLWADDSPHVGESSSPKYQLLQPLDHVGMDEAQDWERYMAAVEAYAGRNDVRLGDDPFKELMAVSQRVALEKRIKEDFSLKNAQCDKYDYMLAGACGLIGGLVDVLFVGLPGQGAVTKMADGAVDGAVRKFAQFNGWNGPKEGSDPTASAIGFLEGKFRINYDHRHGADVGGVFDMSTKNHHIKSLGHSPDIVGLFFSIMDQFNNTAHFVDQGCLIRIDTKTFELQGSNFVSKIFSGFVNWLGHLFSDVAGSSGCSGRGSGIPIPFYSLLQFINIGEFGQHRQSFAKVAVQVFEKGYDLRHGLALAIPVLIAELLTRIMWTLKQRFVHEQPWGRCLPSGSIPELRRMLLVAHGTLCLVDVADAGVRSGGNMITFMLRSNVVAWVRCGTLALKELNAWYREGDFDIEAVDQYLDAELQRLCKA